MAKRKTDNIHTEAISVVALRGITIFPYAQLSFEIGRSKTIAALEKSYENGEGNKHIFLVTQKDAKTESPVSSDLYSIGTFAVITQIVRLPNNIVRVTAEGRKRGRIESLVESNSGYEGQIKSVEDTTRKCDNPHEMVYVEAMVRVASDTFAEYAEKSSLYSPEMILSIITETNPGILADLIAAYTFFPTDKKQMILEETDVIKRLDKVILLLSNELEVFDVKKRIVQKTKESMERQQKEFYLREQMKIIQDELGDKDGIKGEAEDYRRRVNDSKQKLPEYVLSKLEKEISRFEKVPAISPECVVLRNYIEAVLELPWGTATKERNDIKKATEILNKDHYGLEKVKERILEFLAVRTVADKADMPILCLVGPPGVGKTSIAASIAKALNRKYMRISLGGVKDEAEIRGHRKTYIGAMPGRIIQTLRQAKSSNPLILMDEVDKIGMDMRGDPASALLEVFDSEQNKSFRDHYMELDFDLSDVLFICTANTVDTIPPALRDRLEIVRISSYTEIEKLNIAKEYIVAKQMKKNGLRRNRFKIDDDAIVAIIANYTKEAGVRQLERVIGELCRKAVKGLITGTKPKLITADNLESVLGKYKYTYEKIHLQPEVGVARGLAWTVYGGDTLSVEVNIMPGSGKIELTGKMGDVMKESASAALSYIRARVEELGISPDFYKKSDIHIHIPEGAVPKDGPSAGITMATAMISALTSRPVNNTVGMTGEITIRGKVLPIGGLKEKVIAGKRAGLQKILLPSDNEKDLEEISPEIKDGMSFVLVKDMGTVIAEAIGIRASSGNPEQR